MNVIEKDAALFRFLGYLWGSLIVVDVDDVDHEASVENVH